MIWQYTCPLPRICIHNEYMGVITQHTNNPSSCKGVCTHLQSNIWDLWTLPSTRSGPVYGQCIPDKSAACPQSYGAGAGTCSRAGRTGLGGTATIHLPSQRVSSQAEGERCWRNCQHWHSTVSLFRWALSGSSRICKEALMSFASPAESRGSQWTSKAGQWY